MSAHGKHPSSPTTIIILPTQTPGLLSLSKPKQQQQQRTPPPQRPRARAPAHRIQPQAESAIPSDPFAMLSSTAIATPPRPKQQRRLPLPHYRPAKTLLPAFEFPVCDDLSDTDDAAPPTPYRRSRPRCRPAPTLPTTTPHPQGKRAPSDSGMIFAMSSDESGSEHPPSRAHSNGYKAQVQPSAELNALFANLALARTGMRTPPPQAREAMYEAMARREVNGYTGGRGTGQVYFASSSFQNSPSPEELPDPLFV
ncbi:hypothetical protein DXG01_002888 [Tephrocybe rancida]|nr:hypothetical protein DXG01_002888 [Tephrocybe rancida]